MKKFFGIPALILSISLVAFQTALAHDMHDHAGSPAEIGKVSFPISCSKQAQDHVEHGLAMFHSFLFDDAEAQFKAAAEADPTCAIAYWAQAIGLFRPLAYRPSDADMQKSWELIQKADELKPRTPREKDFVEAAMVLYRPDTRSYPQHNNEYSARLENIHSTYPEDTEAAVFYALSVLTFADSGHPIEDSEKAIAILNPIFAQHPDHPGVAHYIIHAADAPQLASQGLDAARHYAQIAPAAPHALHMPSHIFARLGLWREDIQSNLASLQAAQNPAANVGAENQLHAMEFLEYAYLQIGQVERTKETMDAQKKISYDQVDPNLHDYVNRTRANSPALLYLETRNWKSAEALTPDPQAEPYNQAITFWAQAVAAGHLHDTAVAQSAVAQYDALLDSTRHGSKPHVAKFMKTRREEARAWLLMLQEKPNDALKLLRKLADKQDVEGKGEIETPAREMLADMLLELNRPAEALAEYERSMKIDPNRFNGLYGAGHAAELIGKHDKAQKYYVQLLKNCAATESQRPELAHASESIRVTLN
jgi:tetratricopeptide (TPR) repeat protein